MSGRDFNHDAPDAAAARRMDALLAEEAARWFAVQREGVLSPEQAQSFMQWLQASPRHVAEYLAVAAMAVDLPAAARQDPTPLEELLARTQPEVVAWQGAEAMPASAAGPAAFAAARGRTRDTSQHRRRSGWVVGMAAVLALAVVAGAVSWMADRPEVYHYATRHGEQGEWPLPDGSQLRLNSDSAVSLNFGRRHRQVELVRGQALFDVADQPERPFEVRVGSHLVKDIGTVFDVYRQSTGDTTVTVMEGRVRIWGGSAGVPARGRREQAPLADLGAGERAQVSSSGALKSRGSVDPAKATAWMREEIVFENEPLAVVVEEFNRYNQVQIRIDGAMAGALPVTGAFGIRDVETFTAFLDSLPELQATVTADAVLIRRR